jgi:hypothetical protein
MAIDISSAKKYLQQGDIAAIAKNLNVSKNHVHKVIAGKAPKLEITLAVLRKAEQRKRESEEIERLQKAL